MCEQHPAGDEQVVLAEDILLSDHHENQADLRDRGVSQQATVVALCQGKEIGADKADDANGRSDRQPGGATDQKQLVDGEQRRGTGRCRNQRGKSRVRRLVDVQRPAIGREDLELGNNRNEDQEKGQHAPLEQRRHVGCHAVDVERAGGVIGEDDAHQHQDRNHLRGDQELETGTESAFITREQDQSTGRDHDQLEKHEQVEQVAGHHDAAQGHDEDQQNGHGATALLEQRVLEVERGEQAREVDHQYQYGLGKTQSQVDCEGRRRASGEDLHCIGHAGSETPGPVTGEPTGECEYRQRQQVAGKAPLVAQQTEQKSAAE